MQDLADKTQEIPQASLQRPLLFATRTCPACRVATKWLDARDLPYEKIYTEESQAAAEWYGIRSVPTMVAMHPQKGEMRLTGIPAIKAYYSQK